MGPIDKVIDEIIETEGGLVDDPNDPGGITNMGVTIPALTRFRGKPCTANDIRNLTRKEVHQLYMHDYVDQPGLNFIQEPTLLANVIDTAVNMGRVTAVKMLQRAVGAKDDGLLGPITQGKILAQDQDRLRNRFACMRILEYGRLISENYKAREAGTATSDRSEYTLGWLRRSVEFIV